MGKLLWLPTRRSRARKYAIREATILDDLRRDVKQIKDLLTKAGDRKTRSLLNHFKREARAHERKAEFFERRLNRLLVKIENSMDNPRGKYDADNETLVALHQQLELSRVSLIPLLSLNGELHTMLETNPIDWSAVQEKVEQALGDGSIHGIRPLIAVLDELEGYDRAIRSRREFVKRTALAAGVLAAPGLARGASRDEINKFVRDLLEKCFNDPNHIVSNFFPNPTKRRDIINGYDHAVKYHDGKFTDIIKAYRNLEIISYEQDHLLGSASPKTYPSAEVLAGVLLQFEGDKITVWLKERKLLFKIKSNRSSVYFFKNQLNPKSFTAMDIHFNLTAYICYCLLKPSYDAAVRNNTHWKSLPWRKLKAKVRTQVEKRELKPPINKEGELFFYGQNWCKPCKKFGRYLTYNKIKFREKESSGKESIPYLTYTLKGKRVIVRELEKMIAFVEEIYENKPPFDYHP